MDTNEYELKSSQGICEFISPAQSKAASFSPEAQSCPQQLVFIRLH
jgi:hypothetical protein